MTTKSPAADPRAVIVFIGLSALALVLGTVLLRPARASLWPRDAAAWLSGAHGRIGLDQPR